MYNIIPLILILIALSIIIVIVVKKFSVLASLDIENMQSEKEAKFKEQIIGNRIKRNVFKYSNKAIRAIAPLMEASSEYSKKFYNKLISYKEEKQQEKESEKIQEKSMEQLFIEINDYIKNDDSASAEKLLIQIISQDSQNIDAFKKLGKLYSDRKSYTEAKQTIQHAIKLIESNSSPVDTNRNAEDQAADLYFELTQISAETDDLESALSNINKALSIEPNNPRYLDIKLEISIMKNDKLTAEETYVKMKEVNPENQKLGEIWEKINKIETENDIKDSE